MSEYQYYEFRAIDRPLTKDEMDELRSLSSRAEITPTSFSNTYNYGSFRGKPEALMDRHFDAFVYDTNWGMRRLMFRIPRRFLDVEVAEMYCDGETLSLEAKDEHVVLDFSYREEEGGGWADGEPWMGSLITLRADLMRGDYRALYLGWLASLVSDYREDDAEDDDQLEPPVPPGLAKLSGPLQTLAEFLWIDDDLIEVAAAASVGEPPAEPPRDELAKWIKSLPAVDKEDYLLRFVTDEGDLLLRAELSKRFRESTAPKAKGKRPAPVAGRRTVAQLLAARDGLAEEKARKEAEAAARERAKREREKAEARTKYLDELARREPAAWREVETLIATKRPNDYDQAVDLLVALRDLAARSGRADEADAKVVDLRRRHARKPSLMERFDSKKLPK